MILKRGLTLVTALALALLAVLVVCPAQSLAEDLEYFAESNDQLDSTIWGNAADRIDRLADTAFACYLKGEFGTAYGYVSDAYFQVYEITGFERNTLNYVSGPRKNAVELQFSTCKAAVKKSNEDAEVQKEVRTELVKLKTMIREDANKLAVAIANEPTTEMSYWYEGKRVDSDPWADLAGDPNAKAQYASWTAAYEAMEELLETSATAYNGKDFSAALDNVNTAFYSVYEESGLSHEIYSALSIEDREAADAQFETVKNMAKTGNEKFQSKKYKREIKNLKGVVSEKAAAIDAKDEAEKAAAAAEAASKAAESTGTAAKTDTGMLTFWGAFGIIVREGLEAILIIAAIIAYLVKSGNRRSLKSVYIGALLGVAASFVAAAVLAWAKSAFASAGMAQEIIEGVTALIAVCVLFYVSNWMISRAEAASWSRYIDSKVQNSVASGSSFALAFTAFLSVFREGAEVVLFYQPMLQEGHADMVWLGFGVGCVVLVFVYLAITKLSIRLPIKIFFTATSILMAVMCVSFLGNGIKELAEGNVFDMTMHVPAIPENDVLQVLGIYPYLETLVPQLILSIILLVTFMMAHYRGKMDALRRELTPGAAGREEGQPEKGSTGEKKGSAESAPKKGK